MSMLRSYYMFKSQAEVEGDDVIKVSRDLSDGESNHANSKATFTADASQTAITGIGKIVCLLLLFLTGLAGLDG